jgi:serine/threonine-protein kinase
VATNKEDLKFILQRFGKYLLLDHLVDGGMAKICRARFLDEKANKIVAIKMIQSKFSKDDNFIRMFMDEVKVSFGLIHPNIAQTYDMGLVDHQLYTVMEYVDGKNLKQFMDMLRRKKFVFPVEISIYIISQVCQGLSYAHNFTDSLTGKKLNIVHRDISPHNIMITYDGAVKVIDFGIAKAQTNSDATQAGTIKGKLSYLAPEYIDGYELDHRYDMFAVGITLWELLCSKKLFTANNDIAVLKEIQKCNIAAPSTINPNVSKELDAIVLKALAKDRNNRYQNMEQFNRALVKYLYSSFPDFNSSDLGYFSQELFKEAIKEDKIKLFEFGKIDLKPYLQDLSDDSTELGIKVEDDSEARKREQELDFGFEKEEEVTRTNLQRIREAQGGKKNIKAGGTQVGKKLPLPPKPPEVVEEKSEPTLELVETDSHKLMGETRTNASNSIGTNRDLSNIRSTSVTAQKSFRKKAKANNQVGSTATVASIIILATVAIYYFKDDIVKKIDTNLNREIAREKEIKKSRQEVTYGRLILSNLSPYQTIFINGKQASYKALGIKVPVDEKIVLRIEEDGRAPFEQNVELTEENDSLQVRIPELKYIPYGELYSGSSYTAGTKLIIQTPYGKIERRLPLTEPVRLPAGSYQAKIENSVLNIRKSVDFNVKEDQRILLPD